MAEIIEELDQNIDEGLEDVKSDATNIIGEVGNTTKNEEMKTLNNASGVFFKRPLSSIGKNGRLFFYNALAEDGGIFLVEPYIWFLIGLIISIILLVRSDGENMSSELSTLWIVFGIAIIIVFGFGKFKSEG